MQHYLLGKVKTHYVVKHHFMSVLFELRKQLPHWRSQSISSCTYHQRSLWRQLYPSPNGIPWFWTCCRHWRAGYFSCTPRGSACLPGSNGLEDKQKGKEHIIPEFYMFLRSYSQISALQMPWHSNLVPLKVSMDFGILVIIVPLYFIFKKF